MSASPRTRIDTEHDVSDPARGPSVEWSFIALAVEQMNFMARDSAELARARRADGAVATRCAAVCMSPRRHGEGERASGAPGSAQRHEGEENVRSERARVAAPEERRDDRGDESHTTSGDAERHARVAKSARGGRRRRRRGSLMAQLC